MKPIIRNQGKDPQHSGGCRQPPEPVLHNGWHYIIGSLPGLHGEFQPGFRFQEEDTPPVRPAWRFQSMILVYYSGDFCARLAYLLRSTENMKVPYDGKIGDILWRRLITMIRMDTLFCIRHRVPEAHAQRAFA